MPTAGSIVFEPIRFVKVRAVTKAALDFANTAVEIALGLIGIMALWLGLIKIAEAAGFVALLTRALEPVTRRLFPDVPRDHPAVGAMIMNIAANMLGLSNAATPMGLKAMEELNKLNTRAGTATNAMCTFLVINTSGLTLIPATAIAVRAAAGSDNPGIIIGTSLFGAACATTAGLIAVKLLQRLKRYRVEQEVSNG
jgi:spore maturation protein A